MSLSARPLAQVNVRYVEDLRDELSRASVVHVLHGKNTDSGNWAAPALPDDFYPAADAADDVSPPRVEKAVLFQVIADLRVIKTKAELLVLQHVSNVTSAAHVDVMRNTLPGMGEYQLESLFLHYCYYRGGCRLPAYAAPPHTYTHTRARARTHTHTHARAQRRVDCIDVSSYTP
jgi:Xaa-Pro dipeptidase